MLTGSGRLAGVDVADDDHVNVHLFFTREKSASVLYRDFRTAPFARAPENAHTPCWRLVCRFA